MPQRLCYIVLPIEIGQFAASSAAWGCQAQSIAKIQPEPIPSRLSAFYLDYQGCRIASENRSKADRLASWKSRAPLFRQAFSASRQDRAAEHVISARRDFPVSLNCDLVCYHQIICLSGAPQTKARRRTIPSGVSIGTS